MVRAIDTGSSSPGSRHCVVFLRKRQVYKWVTANLILGSTFFPGSSPSRPQERERDEKERTLGTRLSWVNPAMD